MKYVQMEESHVEQIADLEKQCFSDPWSIHSVRYELTNPLSLWVVALSGDSVIGYVGSQTVMEEADMMNLAVKPDCRRRGIGEELVNALVDALKSKGAHSLTLEVRASNQAAISLYEKLGFCEVGRRPGYYVKPKEDALILRKEWEV